MLFSNTIIYLLGFAGTGKYTIAKEIVKLSNFKLIDNHLINNPIFSVIELDGKSTIHEEIWAQVRKIKETVFDTILNYSPANLNFVFTNEIIEGVKADFIGYSKVASLAEKRNSLFIPIRLICESQELARRVSTPGRWERFKSTDQNRAINNAANHEVYKPNHSNTFTLDVTTLSANEAAKIIINKSYDKYKPKQA